MVDSVVFHEMNFEWRVVVALQTEQEAGHVGGLSRKPSMIVNQTQNLPAIILHLDPSFKNR